MSVDPTVWSVEVLDRHEFNPYLFLEAQDAKDFVAAVAPTACHVTEEHLITHESAVALIAAEKDDPDGDNEKRASRVRAALRAYDGNGVEADGGRIDSTDVDEIEEIVSDFFCDIRHLVDELGLQRKEADRVRLDSTFDELVERGRQHYLAEREDAAAV